jgi:phenylacetate-CoA ligase
MYERIFRDVLFPFYEERIKRRHTHAYLQEYERSQWFDGAGLEHLRLAKLNRLIAHCWENVAFLAAHWRAAGLAPAPLSSVAELSSYPVIDKSLITANFEQMRATGFNGRRLMKTTGGSTGDPMKFEYSEESYARRTAVMWRSYRWAGADLGRRTAYVWGAGAPRAGWRGIKDRVYHGAFNRLFLNSFDMSDSNLGGYIADLNAFRPRVIVGYVAPLVLLARWIVEQRAEVRAPQTILTGAEPLTAVDRALIEQAFRAPVYNTYGCREFMLLASECGERNGLHVSADHLIVETVDASGRTVIGESGDVCVTDLHNYAMPFVRYRNGDRATTSARACPCGRGLPLFESVDGRILDVIVTPDGGHVPGEFFVYVMLDFPHVRRYQVVQHARDDVEMVIVPRERLTDFERLKMRKKMAERLGGAVNIRISEVEDIPVNASGKRRVTVSKIAR